EATQTVTFGAGEFPSYVHHKHNIRSHIEAQSRLNGKKIKEIVFIEPVKLGKNSSNLFYDLSELESIEGANLLDTSEVTSMSHMFSTMPRLKKVDVSNWNTSQVTTMSNMFSGAKNLLDIDVSQWDTSQVTDMSNLFENAEKLERIDVSSWNTGRVKYMSRMFEGVRKLTSIDVSNWDTNKVTSMIRMFYSQSLTSLDLSKWNTTAVEYADDMFPYYLEELTIGKEFRFDGKTGIREK
ncbi:BspA family leucine-rich repeat surface protein, partial [Enterococcus silesiacus]|uniref:BspA family leucine-rich repeat surface protein n=1 Tax=Enterococcus silesiacus TaxID=332949 RepID=UPI000AC87D0B